MASIKYQFKGNIPSKKNSKQVFCRVSMKYGKPKAHPTVVSSPAHKKWHKKMMKELKECDFPKGKIAKTKKVTLVVFHKMNKNGAFPKSTFDLTNKAESVMDLLVDWGTLLDDDYNTIPHVDLIFGGFRDDSGADLEIIF